MPFAKYTGKASGIKQYIRGFINHLKEIGAKFQLVDELRLASRPYAIVHNLVNGKMLSLFISSMVVIEPHAYVDMSKVYLVMLSKDTPSPFAPENTEVKAVEPTTNKPTAEVKGKSKSDKKVSAPEESQTVNVKIDIDGIASRVVQLPIDPSGYYGVNCIDGKVYYYMYSQKTGEHGC